MKKINKIAFIGLGVMGYPMAGHLSARAEAGVTVYNRAAEKARLWQTEFAGKSAGSPAEAAQEADVIFLCVGNDDDLRSVLTGPKGVMAGIREGTIIVDHTTVSANIAREMHGAFREKGCAFLDAPVSGGQSGAESGSLTVMAGGDEEAFNQVAALILSAYAREIRLMGPPGAGQLTKMVNQICIAGLLQGLSEGLAFGLRAGLDIGEVLQVIGKGAAQSWQMDNRGPTMIRDKFDFGFAVDWMVKDLGIALEEARRNGAELTITKEVLRFYKELQDRGCGRLDTSSLIKRLISP